MEFEEIFGFPPPSEEELNKFGEVFQHQVQSVLDAKKISFDNLVNEGMKTFGIDEEQRTEFLRVVNELTDSYSLIKNIRDCGMKHRFRMQ